MGRRTILVFLMLSTLVLGTDDVLSKSKTDLSTIQDEITFTSTGDTMTIYVVPYTKFVQYFNISRINYVFGEIDVKRTNGTKDGLMLANFNDRVNKPLVLLPNDYIDISGTVPFLVSAGDTIAYYRSCVVECESDTSTGWVDVADTVGFSIELYDIQTGSIVSVIDTAGYYPHTNLMETAFAYFGTYDTSIRHKYVVPSSVSGQIEAKLRIRPIWHGDSSRYAIGRWDIASNMIYSREDRAQRAIYDSLWQVFIAGFLKRAAVVSAAEKINLDISPSISRNGIFTASFEANIDGNYTWGVYNINGQSVMTFTQHYAKGPNTQIISLPRVGPGNYYVVLKRDNDILNAVTVKLSY